MENMTDNKLITPLATAWNEFQGSYSEELANKIINFEKRQKLRFRSVLDICCGSGNLLKVMNANEKKCYATEILDDFVTYNQQNNPFINIKKVNNILGFDNIKTFDLITCTNKVINNLNDISLWSNFFNLVYKNLNNGGVFIFDYYTENQLNNWNKTTHKETDTFDHVRNVISTNNPLSSTINDVFYLKKPDNKYKRINNIETKYGFRNEVILNEIKSAQFRYLIPVDANLKPIPSLNDSKIAYIIAIKREG
ncbi:MAG: methyltransferase domain-containing protein [Clostridia bacterium]|nr:methyltransferase domain-containing protein [Clostridia bacterium]